MPSKRISRLVKILTGAVVDAEDEIFQLDGRLERFVHFWALVWRQFVRHRCLVRASALSYSTLLALIPLLAVALSITSSFLANKGQENLEQAVEQFISSVVPPAIIGPNVSAVNTPLPEPQATNFAVGQIVAETNGLTNAVALTTNAVPPTESLVVPVTVHKEIARQVWSFVKNTRSGTLGATGMVLLVFVAISLLSRIEETFNDIWGVTRGRSWLRQIQLYCTTIMFGPLLLVAALGLVGGAQFQSVKDFVAQTPFIGKFIFDLLPLLVMWLAFSLVYLLVPNTKVRFSAALIGGAVAGLLWHVNNLCGFLYVSRYGTNSEIYGKLGLVPVFMIGIYFSWVILLFGAQIAYAFQNRAAYLQDRLADNVNQRGREFVALRLMTCLGQRFQNGLRPATVFQLSAELGVPSRLTQSVLHTLCATRLVTEVAGPEAAFVPARPLDTINAYDILLALRTGTGQELPLREDPALTEIYGEFARIEQAERTAAAAITLRALVNRQPPPMALPEPKPVEPKVEIAAAPVAMPTDKMNIIEAGEPVVEQVEVVLAKAEKPLPTAEKLPPRRDVVMPSETDFPL